ncbi:MAG: HEAT repeat domain-containing protein [Planctomycetes bacterium]|nr:HEAT repeat domain-containing protein [Planctomycetota bacterium]
MRRERTRSVAIGVAVAGTCVLATAAFVLREPLLREWHALRLRLSGGNEAWALARTLESSGPAAREAAERWYLDALEEPSAAPAGAPEEPAIERGEVRDGWQQVGFYFPREERKAKAAAGLARLRSERAIPLLVKSLIEADPALPVFDSPFDSSVSAGASPARQRLLCFHYTTSALFEIGPAAAPALAEALEGQTANVRLQAALALHRLGPAAAPAAPALLAALRDGGWTLRSEAFEALLAIDPTGEACVPVLLAIVREDPRPDQPLGFLARIAKRSPRAVERLCSLLRDSEGSPPGLRPRVAEAIGDQKLVGDAIVNALASVLQDPDDMVRHHAVTSLSKLAAGGPELVAALAARLREDPHVGVRQAAALALGKLGPAASQAVPALREALRHENDLLREYAESALRSIEGAR